MHYFAPSSLPSFATHPALPSPAWIDDSAHTFKPFVTEHLTQPHSSYKLHPQIPFPPQYPPKPLPREVRDAPLLLRPPSVDIYTPEGRSRLLDSIGVPPHLHDPAQPKPSNVPSTVTPSISATDAISKAESELSGTYNQLPTKLKFVAKQDGSVALTHVVQVRDDSKAMWYEAFVDAHSGEIVQLPDLEGRDRVGQYQRRYRNLTGRPILRVEGG